MSYSDVQYAALKSICHRHQKLLFVFKKLANLERTSKKHLKAAIRCLPPNPTTFGSNSFHESAMFSRYLNGLK